VPIFRFLTESELDYIIKISTVVVLPYQTMWSSGMFIRALNNKKPVISPVPMMLDFSAKEKLTDF
jgi:hypothetical protein